MNTLKYNRINGPKKTVIDYLQTLNNEELKNIYTSSFFYDLKMPDLMKKKMQEELLKRNINPQPSLFSVKGSAQNHSYGRFLFLLWSLVLCVGVHFTSPLIIGSRTGATRPIIIG